MDHRSWTGREIAGDQFVVTSRDRVCPSNISDRNSSPPPGRRPVDDLHELPLKSKCEIFYPDGLLGRNFGILEVVICFDENRNCVRKILDLAI